MVELGIYKPKERPNPTIFAAAKKTKVHEHTKNIWQNTFFSKISFVFCRRNRKKI